MMKVLSCRFEICLGPFNMLSVKGCSETGLFRHLSNHVFRTPKFRILITYEGHFFFFFGKCLKLDADLISGAKNSEKVFCLLDNCF